jgi:exodeoxyribonuclease VII small subunit
MTMSETLNYEAARDELLQVVQKLESGGTSLQQSIELWERGEELANVCQRWLDGARARFDAAVANDRQRDGQTASDGSEATVAAPPD